MFRPLMFLALAFAVSPARADPLPVAEVPRPVGLQREREAVREAMSVGEPRRTVRPRPRSHIRNAELDRLAGRVCLRDRAEVVQQPRGGIHLRGCAHVVGVLLVEREELAMLAQLFVRHRP